ncbi:RpiB/LacA/LacB family sugar-phosphate isomerase [Bacillus sp. N9]
MKTTKEKHVLVGADFAGFPLKEAVVQYLINKGWNITDIGVKSENEKIQKCFIELD